METEWRERMCKIRKRKKWRKVGRTGRREKDGGRVVRSEGASKKDGIPKKEQKEEGDNHGIGEKRMEGKKLRKLIHVKLFKNKGKFRSTHSIA